MEPSLPIEVTRANFKEIVGAYDNVIVVLDGVIWRQDGVEVVDGAAKVCSWIQKMEKNVYYISNRDNKSREQLCSRLASLGVVGVTKNVIVTSSSVLATHVARNLPKRKKVYVMGGKGLKAELDDQKVKNLGHGPDPLVVTPFFFGPAQLREMALDPEVALVAVGADPHLNSGKASRAASYVRRGAGVVACDDAAGRSIGDHIVPGTGAGLNVLRQSLRFEFSCEVFGLPRFRMLRALRALQPTLDARRTLLIGASTVEDVAFARDNGIDSLQTLTGSADRTEIEAMTLAMKKRPPDEVPKPTPRGDATFDDSIVLFIVGGPGCGKGTQCERLKSEFKLTHISSGDLLRDEVASGSELGERLKKTMEKGELVSMETVLEMIKNRMTLAVEEEGAKGFLIDGYPREEEQGILFESMIRPCHATIYFNAMDDTMLTRMRKRAMTSGRADDNEVTMRERLKTFHKHSEPVINYFKAAKKLIEVDAEAGTEIVYHRTIEGLKKMFLKQTAVLFIIGGPGCGKGTQCDRLKETFRLTHISSGDLLREEVQSGSKKGMTLKKMMDRGELVPMATVLSMIQNKMISEAMRGTPGFLLDGYPREEAQASAFETDVRPGCCSIYFKIDDETMLQRMRHRALTSGRSDDNEDTMQERLKTFHAHSEPVVKYFKENKKLIQIYAGETIDTIFHQTIDGMTRLLLRDSIVIFIVGGPGCGKGTQCERLSAKYNLTHISSGDLLRDEVASGSALGQQLQEMMTRGELVPMLTVLRLIQCAMLRSALRGGRGFLIDGYPREEAQGVMFETRVTPGTCCIYFDASDETMLMRMRHRALTSGRADDNEDTMKLRLKTYRRHAEAVVDYFRDSKKLIQISAEETTENVFYETCLELRARGIFPGLGKEDMPAIPTYIIPSLGDIADWIYTPPPKRPPVPESCCCAVRTASEAALLRVLKPPHPTIVTVLASSGSQRNRVVENLAKQFGLLNLDEAVILAERINDLDSEDCFAIREAQTRRSPPPWTVALKLLWEKLNSLKDGDTSFNGVVIGIEAREAFFRPPSDSLLFDTARLMEESAVISYLVMPRDKLYRRYVLEHVPLLERRMEALGDVVTTPNWSKVWTEYVRIKFRNGLRRKVQTADANTGTLALSAEVEKHLSKSFLRDLKIIVVVGGPGSGKHELCKRIVDMYKFKTVSLNKLLDWEIKSKTLIGKALRKELGMTDSDTDLPHAARSLTFPRVEPLLRNALVRGVVSGHRGFLVVGGFPRNETDAILFDTKIATTTTCVNLEASDKVMLERSMKSGEKTESEIFKSIAAYRASFAGVVDYFRRERRLTTLDGDPAAEVVFASAVEELQSRKIFIPKSVAAELRTKIMEEEKALLENLAIVFMVGGPFTDKTAHCERLMEAYNLAHLTTTQLVKQEANSGSELGRELAKMLAVDYEPEMEDQLKVVRKAILKLAKMGVSGVVLDAFPEELQQGLDFDGSIVECCAVIHLDATDEFMLARAIAAGDDEEEIKQKIKRFNRNIIQISEHYKNRNRYVKVSADGELEEVFAEIVENLKEKEVIKKRQS